MTENTCTEKCLYRMAYLGKISVMKSLIESGDLASYQIERALEGAMKGQQTEAAELILNITKDSLENSLLTAMRSGKDDMVRLVLARHPPVTSLVLVRAYDNKMGHMLQEFAPYLVPPTDGYHSVLTYAATSPVFLQHLHDIGIVPDENIALAMLDMNMSMGEINGIRWLADHNYLRSPTDGKIRRFASWISRAGPELMDIFRAILPCCTLISPDGTETKFPIVCLLLNEFVQNKIAKFPQSCHRSKNVYLFEPANNRNEFNPKATALLAEDENPDCSEPSPQLFGPVFVTPIEPYSEAWRLYHSYE